MYYYIYSITTFENHNIYFIEIFKNKIIMAILLIQVPRYCTAMAEITYYSVFENYSSTMY